MSFEAILGWRTYQHGKQAMPTTRVALYSASHAAHVHTCIQVVASLYVDLYVYTHLYLHGAASIVAVLSREFCNRVSVDVTIRRCTTHSASIAGKHRYMHLECTTAHYILVHAR